MAIIQERFLTKYLRELSVNEIRIYIFFCYRMDPETGLCKVTFGEIEDYTALKWHAITGALSELQERLLVKWVSTRLYDTAEPEFYQKDLLTIEVKKIC